jgi:transcriptional regulator with XRE-family HTH domain
MAARPWAEDAPDPRSELVDALRMAVRESQFTQSQLAVRLNLDPSTVSRILNGKLAPRWTQIAQIASLCARDIEEFRGLWRGAQTRVRE